MNQEDPESEMEEMETLDWHDSHLIDCWIIHDSAYTLLVYSMALEGIWEIYLQHFTVNIQI